MKSIRLKKVSKSHQDGIVLDDIDLEVPAGEFFALLGPSGCGKTTLLRLIAGLETPDSGTIYLGDEDITYSPINQRSVNIVFQNYALFPHLTLFHNVAYSLMIKKRPKAKVREEVMHLLKTFQLDNHCNKLPSQLSGGQAQRAALARAIINKPDVLLLDEPLAALDFKMREKVLIELIDLQDRLRTTFIYVTHDQSEALTVADHMAIMTPSGDIAQIGTPKDIYEFPKSIFVAKFVGNANMLTGTLSEIKGNCRINIPNLGTFSTFIHEKKGWMFEGCSVVMSLRPEKIFISKKPQKGFSNQLKGSVSQIVYDGRSTQYVVAINPTLSLTVFEQNEEHFPQEDIDYDDEVYLQWQRENVLLLEE